MRKVHPSLPFAFVLACAACSSSSTPSGTSSGAAGPAAGGAGSSGSGPSGSGGGMGSGGGSAGSGAGGAAPVIKTFMVGDRPLYNLAVDATNAIWATSEVDEGPGQASVFRLAAGASDAQRFVIADGSSASNTPATIAIDADGDAWLAMGLLGFPADVDDPSVGVVRVSPSGDVLAHVHNTGASNPNPCSDHPCQQNPFAQPVGPALDPSGNVWLTDDYAHAFVTELDATGLFVRAHDVDQTLVASKAIDAAGNVWAAMLQSGANRIVKVVPGVAVQGPFALPDGAGGAGLQIALDASGNIWIASSGETTTGAVIELAPDGTVLANTPIPDGGTLNGIAIDGAGTIWVVDPSFEKLYQLDPSGKIVRTLGDLPATPPVPLGAAGRGLVIDGDGNVWLAAGNNGAGLLVEVVGVAKGPQYFPYAGPQFPY